MAMRYELYYWPGIQGRGEFVRLALEDAGANYLDIALRPEEEGGGVPAILELLDSPDLAQPPFAPPFLKAGRQVIGQTANILLFLGPRLGLAPAGVARRRWAHQLQLTIADWLTEIHDTHHPLASSLYYEQQKAAAKRRAAAFLAERLPKFLGYFERVLARNPDSRTWLVGDTVSYVDLSTAQCIAGLGYAFPQATRRLLPAYPRLQRLHQLVFTRPRLRAYLASPRRLPFNNDDIFRHYPELDG